MVHSYGTRNATSSLLTLPKCNKSIGQKCISYTGPKVWNGLTEAIRCAPSLPSFKSRYLKALYRTTNVNMPEGLREDPYHWTELPSLNKDYYYHYYYNEVFIGCHSLERIQTPASPGMMVLNYRSNHSWHSGQRSTTPLSMVQQHISIWTRTNRCHKTMYHTLI